MHELGTHPRARGGRGGSACAQAAQGSASYDQRSTGQAKGSGSRHCWTDSACRQSWGESRILAIQAPLLGSDASTLLSREPTFLPGPSPAPRLLLPSASYLSLQCLESVILSGLGCEQLWGQGEACCEVMGFPWGLVSELKACQSWRGHPSSAPAARFPLPGPRQPTSTSPWGGRDS